MDSKIEVTWSTFYGFFTDLFFLEYFGVDQVSHWSCEEFVGIAGVIFCTPALHVT